MDDSAIDVNLSGNMFFDKVIYRYFQNTQLTPLKIGELNGETKLSGSLLKPYVSFCILRKKKNSLDLVNHSLKRFFSCLKTLIQSVFLFQKIWYKMGCTKSWRIICWCTWGYYNFAWFYHSKFIICCLWLIHKNPDILCWWSLAKKWLFGL